LPVPVALVEVLPLLLCVPAEELPVPSLDAPTPLPAVALPPLPTVLELPVLPDVPVPEVPEVPDVPEVALPSVLVVVLLCALRTPVPPSAWRPAAKPLLSVVLVPPVVLDWAKAVAEAAAISAAARVERPTCFCRMRFLLIWVKKFAARHAFLQKHLAGMSCNAYPMEFAIPLAVLSMS
jgi:hypothetical protein